MNLKKAIILILISTMFVGCGQKQQSANNTNNKKKSLLIYCAAGINKPMEDIGKDFEKEYGVKVQFTYANSSQLISQMEVSHKGDLCVLASDEDYQAANAKSLTLEKKDLVYHVPVIAVTKGNPASITNLKDFSKTGVKIILGDSNSSPLGKIASKLFQKAGIEEQVKSNVVATVPTVNEIVSFLSMKKANASIIWEDNALNAKKNIDMIQIAKEENMIKVVPISTLKSTKDKDLATKFMNFTASDKEKAIFVKYNLKPIK